jgi:chromosome segregation ATPase
MREEDQEERGFNPVKFGLIGALIVASAVGFFLWLQSHNQTVEALQNQQAMTQQDLEKTQQERDELRTKLNELTETAHATSTQFKRQLLVRESQLSSVKKEKEAENRAAEAKLGQIQKEKLAAEAEIAALKKEMDAKAAELKKVQGQIGKSQLDLQKVRADFERASKNYEELQRKIRVITEGDQAAADAMVQQLADARRELKQEREARRRVEEELDALRSGYTDEQ